MQKQHHPTLTKDSNSMITKYLKIHMEDFNIQFKNTKFMKYLHECLLNASKITQEVVINETLEYINEERPINIKSSYFFHESIVDDIKRNMNMMYQASFIIHNTFNFIVTIHFNPSQKPNLKKMMYYIKFLLVFSLQHYRNEKGRHNFEITLYLSDMKKGISSGFKNTIESKHINSGFFYYDPTISSSNIVIFRREEWFKVLVHECVHCFNLDFQSSKISFRSLMSDTFFITSSMDMNESFTEFWGRTLNCAILTYHGIESKNYTDFNHIFSINLNLERIHSMNQATKLLKMFGLPYSSIVNPRAQNMTKKLYQETTNAFCYYVVTAILMYNFESSLKWFTNDEYNSISFQKTERQIMIFSYYLKQIAKDNGFIQNMEKMAKERSPIKNMKMSLFELEI
jgi:hypothetical protein